MNTFELSLDLDKHTTIQGITIRRGDSDGTTVRASILDHGSVANLTGATAYLVMRLPDGLHYYRKAATVGTGTVTTTINEAEAASAVGSTKLAYFQISQGGSEYSTSSFAVKVLNDAVAGMNPPESYDDEIAQLVDDWLVAHPEATTTVQDNSLETTKLTRWAFSRLSPLRIITTNAIPYIAFTTSDQKMTIPRDSIIVGPQYYYVFAQETVVDLSTVSSTAKVVGFNPQTKEIIVAPYNNFTVGRITQVLCAIRSGGTHLHIDASFPYTVDGMPYGVEPYTLNMRDVKSFLPENIKSVDHRGYSSIAPENTIPAFLLSRKNGFSYVETDVQFTSDNIPVLLHDDTINRTARNADGTEISSTINIRDITYTQALTYDFGIWKNSRYAGTKIPTLDEFMQLCKNLSIHPYIEIKSSLPTGQETQLLTTVVNIVKKYDMLDNSTFISFNGSYLGEIAAIESTVRLGLLSNQLTQQQIDDIKQINTTHGNEVFVDVSITDTSASNLCMNNDMTLEMWTLSQYTIADFPSYASGATTADFNMNEYYYNYYKMVLA